MGEKERNALQQYLEKNGASYKLTTHQPVYTSAQAAKTRGTPVKSGAKALLFETENQAFILAVIRADKRVDTEKLSQLIGNSRIRLANAKDLRKLTGCEPGALHPFGNLWGIRVILDRSFDVEEINFNAGTTHESIHLRLDDFTRLVHPTEADIAEKFSSASCPC